MKYMYMYSYNKHTQTDYYKLSLRMCIEAPFLSDFGGEAIATKYLLLIVRGVGSAQISLPFGANYIYIHACTYVIVYLACYSCMHAQILHKYIPCTLH